MENINIRLRWGLSVIRACMMFQVLCPPPPLGVSGVFFSFFFYFFLSYKTLFCWWRVLEIFFFFSPSLRVWCVCVSRVPPMGGLPLACYVFTKYEDTSPFATRAPSGPPLLEWFLQCVLWWFQKMFEEELEEEEELKRRIISKRQFFFSNGR
jgi:hypothetical protein